MCVLFFIFSLECLTGLFSVVKGKNICHLEFLMNNSKFYHSLWDPVITYGQTQGFEFPSQNQNGIRGTMEPFNFFKTSKHVACLLE